MKKVFILLLSLFAVMATGTSLKAQEVEIILDPGWNWISYPNTITMEIEEAIGDFVPMEGDVLKSQTNTAIYLFGSWRGDFQFDAGMGYMYYSARLEPVSFSFVISSSALAEVTTDTPTDVTALSAVIGGTVTLPEGNHAFMRGLCWDTNQSPDIEGLHTVNESGEGSFSTTLIWLTPNTTYYVRAYAITEEGIIYGNEESFTTLDGLGIVTHTYVDLGLPSGILWATCNVGADSPEEYGDYFAWGEIQPKSIYNWNTYQHCNGSYNSMTKYCINSSYGYNGYSDYYFSLLPEDDAATVNWGEDWRIPTKAEWEELFENTTHTWTTLNGVNGRLFTASNGNSIFLPATGYRNDGNVYNVGSSGFYWSNSLDMARSNNAWYFCFDPNYFYMNSFYRRYGSSIRPVLSISRK